MSVFRPRIRACINCTMIRFINGRDLCTTCYGRAWRHGTLIDFERRFRAVEEVVEEITHLRPEGHTTAQVADRLGVSSSGLRKALQAARRKNLLADDIGPSKTDVTEGRR